MSDILVFTNRFICTEEFISRIEKIAKEKPKGLVLREKDLCEEEYTALAEEVLKICRSYDTLCILHNFENVAVKLECDSLHLPLHKLRLLSDNKKQSFKCLGASVHSVNEAVEAEKLGCTYITAGHIYDTDCKAGSPGKGLQYLKEVCENVSIPVFAIGGIKAENVADLTDLGAKGVCVMSGAMQCLDVKKYLSEFINK